MGVFNKSVGVDKKSLIWKEKRLKCILWIVFGSFTFIRTKLKLYVIKMDPNQTKAKNKRNKRKHNAYFGEYLIFASYCHHTKKKKRRSLWAYLEIHFELEMKVSWENIMCSVIFFKWTFGLLEKIISSQVYSPNYKFMIFSITYFNFPVIFLMTSR